MNRKYEGMRVSILGDSISTYPGCNPQGYAVFYKEDIQSQTGVMQAEDTWWRRVLDTIGAQTEINASFAGGTVSGEYFPSACLERCVGVLGDPDMIRLYSGINEYFCGAYMGDFTTDLEPENGVTFREAYAVMLKRLMQHYPKAQIWCATILRGKLLPHQVEEDPYGCNKVGRALEDYNEVIREMAGFYGCHLADLAASGIAYDSLDGCHPTATGMQTLARLWLEALQG